MLVALRSFAISTLVASVAAPVFAQAPDTSSEESRERVAMERFLALLEKQPRFGTALDKVYAYHIERGTLDDFLAAQKKKTANGDQAGAAWMLIGLVEFQRGRDGDAVVAFREAERLRTTDALASYYLGKSLLLVGKSDDAAAAYERALDRKPTRADLLEVFQALGQIYQRARKTELALKVWDRWEQAFPDDLRVQEQIAGILADEGDHAGALGRYEKLAGKATDPYRKVQYQLKAAELKLRLGRGDEALASFETLLGQLKPESWLHRDVRQRIEATFLKTDDYDGLTQYYENWLAKHPDDLDAMGRLGHVLGLQGRRPEAETWYRKALKAAPSNKTLRRALIDQLIQANKFTDAATEYAELDRLEPNNPDTIRAWGQLLVEDKSRPEAERKRQAAEVWKKLLASKPKDAVVTSQVADLFRQAKLTEEAIELYRQAIVLAPNDPQYREYLGEYLHSLDRGPEAVAVWKEIATGDKRNTKTLVRLAEVYRGFGYRTEAVATMGEACALDPEFTDILRYAEMLRDATEHDASLAQLDRAAKLAENGDEREQVLAERIKTYVESDRLTDEIASLEKIVEPQGTAEQWRTLALLYEAGRKSSDAGRAIVKALALDDKSLSTWIVAARLYESTGQFAEAIEANQKLAALDRRARTDYLQRIATLSMRLGKVSEALEAGQDVIAAAPGNPELYQFYATLCFQVGKQNEGLDALRRAVRVNPSDSKALLTLAQALADQFRTDEAIELFWRAFDTAEDLDGKNAIVASLTELYLRTNHFDRMIARLTRLGEEQKNDREATIWLAAAHQAAGDIGTARETLEKLLTDESKDTQLLTQLVRLAELEYDLDQAVAYQRRINELSPSRESRQQLAGLLLRSGEIEEAEAIWLELTSAIKDPHKVYEAIDDLVKHDRFNAALKMSERVLRDNPQDWETLYRQGLSLWKLKREDEALAKFDQLRELPIPQDKPSAKVEFQKAQAAKRGASATSAVRTSPYPPNYPPALMRGNIGYYLQQTFDSNDSSSIYGGFSGRASAQLWSPSNFGEARMVPPALRFLQAAKGGKAGEAMAALEQQAASDAVSTDELWDLYTIATFAQRYANQTPSGSVQSLQSPTSKILRNLSERDDPGGKLMYLSNLRTRGRNVMRSGVVVREGAEPLPSEELDHVLACYRSLEASNPEWLDSVGATAILAQELKLAKRDDAAEQAYRDAVARASDYRTLQSAIQLAMSLGKTDDLIPMVEKLEPQLQAQFGSSQSIRRSMWLQLAQVFGQKQDWDGVMTVIGKSFDARAAEIAAQPRQRRYTSVRTTAPMRVSVQIPGSTGFRSATIEYPQPNSYLDQSSISSMYSVFELLKQQQKTNDLIDFVAKRAETSEGESQLLCHLAITCFLYWSDRKDEALAKLQEAVELAPDDPTLRMQLAELLMKQRKPEQALSLLDAFEPTEHTVLRDRELLALQAAVSLGNIERARQSAERLAGMQLEANIQFQLAQTMHQLGMHEQAENVLGRLRRRSGNQTNTLVQVMQQYVSQGKNDIAAQIAQQLLRRSKPTMGLSPNVSTAESNARTQALQVLQRSGALPKIIARVEGQLEKSPTSVTLMEALAEYYKAAGQNEKSQETLNQLAANLPQDGRALYQAADQLVRSRKYKEACDAYLLAIRKEPARLEDRYYDIQRAFQQAKRTPELAAVLQEIDLKTLGRYSYRIVDIVGELVQQKDTREAGLALFRRAWESLPDQRPTLIGNIRNDELWATDEIFNYAQDAIVPKKGQLADPWRGIGDGLTYYGDGRIEGLLSRLIKAGAKPERRNQFAVAVAAGLKDVPEWRAGEAILGILEAKAGNTDSAQQRFDKLLKDGNVPGRAALLLGQELSSIKPLEPQAIRLMEASITNDDGGMMNEFSYHPGRSLARLYFQSGDRAKARETLLDVLSKADYSRYGSSNPGYGEYQELRSLQQAGQDFLKMEMPLDALRLYQRALADPEKFAAAQRWGGGSSFQQQIVRDMEAAQKALTPEVLSTALSEWVRIPGKKVDGKPTPPVVEFALTVQPRSLENAAVASLFETAVLSAAGKPIAIAAAAPPPSRPPTRPSGSPLQATIVAVTQALKPAPTTPRQAETLDKLREQLAAASAEGDDLSIRIATALVELIDASDGNTTAITVALERLAESAKADPKAGSLSSETQLAVWLAVRHAILHSDASVRAAGQELAEVTLKAARAHADRLWLMAMLREQGQSAADAGDRESAERLWTEMLEEILRVEATPENKAKPATPARVPTSRVPARPATPAPAF